MGVRCLYEAKMPDVPFVFLSFVALQNASAEVFNRSAMYQGTYNFSADAQLPHQMSNMNFLIFVTLEYHKQI
jgi:hypothetical protein